MNKWMFLLIGIFSIAILFFATGFLSKYDKFKKIPGEEQLFREEITDLFDELIPLRYALWPKTETGKNVVGSERVPEELYANAEIWSRTTILPKWLPENLKSWWIPVENHVYQDVLAMRYTIEDYSVQIMDLDNTISFVAKTPFQVDLAGAKEETVESFLISFLKTFFKIPEEKIGQTKFFIKQTDKCGIEGFRYGWIYIEFDKNRPVEKDMWYHDFTFFTDGQTTYVLYGKKNGSNTLPTAAILRGPNEHSKRFKPKT